MSPIGPTPPVPHLPDITKAEPDVIVDGRRVFFVWHPPALADTAPTIPRGALIEHGDRDNHRCVVWLPWASTDPSNDTWTLLSLRPLSIGESFSCSRCGARGGIREGHWQTSMWDKRRRDTP